MKKKMTREELQRMLDSYNEETGHIKEYMIDRLSRLNGDKEMMSNRSKKMHQTKKRTGWYDANKELYQELAKRNFHENISEEQEAKRRQGISIANKKLYKEGKTNLIPGYKGEKGVPAKNRIFEDYQVLWIRSQYNRKKDVFGKKIVYQRIADAMGCSVYAIYTVIKKKNYKDVI